MRISVILARRRSCLLPACRRRADRAGASTNSTKDRPKAPPHRSGGADAAHGLEQLELLRRQRHRSGHPQRRRPACRHRHERRRLRLRQHRRHLGGRPRRQRRAAHQLQVPRHEGACRLRALQGPQARHLLVAGAEDLRRLRGLARPRSAGRAALRLLGHRLPEVRSLQLHPGRDDRTGAQRQGRADAPDDRRLRQDGQGAQSHRPAHRLLALPIRLGRGLGVGSRGRRQPVAHHRRHPGQLAEHLLHPERAGRPGEVRGARPLERSRHARGGQRPSRATTISLSARPRIAPTSPCGPCSPRRCWPATTCPT